MACLSIVIEGVFFLPPTPKQVFANISLKIQVPSNSTHKLPTEREGGSLMANEKEPKPRRKERNLPKKTTIGPGVIGI